MRSKNNITRKLITLFAVIFFITLTALNLYGQPNADSLYFNTPNQQDISVHFDVPVNITSGNTGWTITVSGTAATIAPVVTGSGTNTLTFRITDNNTPATPGIEYSERNSVFVSYDGTGTITMVDPPNSPLSAFGPTQAFNTLFMDCNAFKSDVGLVKSSDGDCSPVSVTHELTYSIKTEYVNSINYDKNDIIIRIAWGDGTVNTKWGAETSPGSGVFNHVFTHTYPDDPSVCTFNAFSVPGINGWGYCYGGGLRLDVSYLNYNEDNEGSGTLQLDIDTIKVCIGTDFTETFTDNTVFNCNAGTEPTYPNIGERKVQFIFGTHASGGIGIPNVYVDDGGLQQITDANGDPIAYPTPSGYYESAVFTYDSISELNPYNPKPFYFISDDIVHAYDPNDNVDDIIEVTFRNWGPCNIYDPFDPAGSAITTTSYIKIIDGPLADAGSDFDICEGDDANLNGSISGTATTASWSTSGDGGFDNPNLLNATYTPGSNDIINGSVTLTLTTDAVGSCPAYSDDVVVTFVAIPNKPTISVTGDLEFCWDGGVTFVTLTANVTTPPAVTSYQWYKDAVVMTDSIAISIILSDSSATGDYTVSALGENPTYCLGPQSDPTHVIAHSLSNLTHPVPATVCENEIAIFSAFTTDFVAGWKWEVSTDGGASFSPTGASAPYSNFTTDTLTITNPPPSFDGYLYRVEIKTPPGQGGCFFKSDAALLTVHAIPTADAGSNDETCADQATYTVSGASSTNGTVVWTSSSGGSFVNNTVDNPVYTINATDRTNETVDLTMTVTSPGPCAAVDSTMTLIVTPLPTADAGSNDETCTDQATYTVSGASSSNGTVVWTSSSGGSFADNTVDNPVYTINATDRTNGTVDLTMTVTSTGSCADAVSIMTLTVTPLPTADAGSNDETCTDQATYTVSGASSGNGTVIWTSSSGGSFADNTVDNPVYTINATDRTNETVDLTMTVTSTGSCADAVSTMTLTVTPLPTADAGSNDETCTDQATYTVSGASSGNGTVVWTSSSGGSFADNTVDNPVYTINATDRTNGTVDLTMTVTSTGSCADAVSTMTLTINPLPDNTLSVDDPVICNGETATITLSNSVIGVNYQLRLDLDDSNVGAAVAGTGGNITFDVTPASTTTYNILATIVATGCDDELTDKPTVTVNPLPTPSITGDNDVCAGDVGKIYTTADVGGNSYDWDISGGVITAGEFTNQATVTWGAASTEWINVKETIDATGCNVTTANYVVTINPGKTTEIKLITGDAEKCEDGSLDLTYQAVTDATQYVWDYSWTGAGIDTTINAPQLTLTIDLTGVAPGNYTIKAAGINGCNVPADYPWSANHDLTINPLPVILAAQTKTICSSDAVNYEVLLSPVNTPAGTIFNWVAPTMSDASVQGSAGVDIAADPAGTLHITDVLENKTGAPITATYTITPTSAVACDGDAVDIVITVNPEPDLVTPTPTVCSDDVTGVTFTDVHTLANSFEIVSITPTGGMAAGGGNATTGAGQAANAIANDTWTNKTAVSQTVTYAVIPRIAAGCIGDEENIVVTIDPEPDLVTPTPTVCSDDVTGVTFTDVHTLANSFEIVSITPTGGMAAGGGNATTGAGQAANAIANDTWTNKTAVSQTVTYAVIPRIAAGCIGDEENIVVTIDPEPDLANLDKTVCSDEAIAVTLADVHTLSDRYNVLSITPQGGLNAGGGNVATANGVLADYISADTWNNKTANPLTVTYNVVPYINAGCVGDAEDIVVTINPEPDLANLDKTVCSDEAIAVTLADVHTLSDRYNVLSITPQGGLNAGGGNVAAANGVLADYISADTWNNKTANPLTVTYNVVPYINAGCVGDAEDIVVTINPEPDLANLDKTVCSDEAIAVTLADVHTLSDRYNVLSITPQGGLNAGGGNVAAANGVLADYISADTWNNKTANPLTVTYNVVPYINAGCVGDAEDIVVTINPEPDLANLDKTVCSDEAIAVTLADVHTLSDRYNVLSITPQGGLNAGGGNVAAANGVLADYISADTWNNKTANPLTVTYNVVPYINAGCVGDAEDIVVTINPEPDLANLDKTVCSDEAIAVTLADVHTLANSFEIVSITPTGGMAAGGGNATTGAGQAANAIANDTWTNKTAVSQTVTYAVIPRIAAGCIGDEENIVVTIDPEPDLANLDKTVCSDEAIAVTLADVHTLSDRYNVLSITPQGGLNAGGGNVAAANGVLADYISADTWNNKTANPLTVTYNVVPYINAGCVGDAEDIVVTIDPEPDLVTPTPTVCSDDVTGVTFTDVHTLANSFEIVSITPTGGMAAGGGNATTGAGQAANAIANDTWTNKTAVSQTVTYAVIPRIAAGCIGDEENIVVTIDPEPDLANLDKTVCSDEAIAVTLADVHTLSDRYNVLSITPQGGLNAGGGNVAAANGVLADYISADTWNNKTANPLTVTYNVVPYINAGCVGDAEDIVVTINPEPDLANLDKTVCSDEAIAVTLADVHTLANSFEIVSITPTGGMAAGGGNATTGAGQAANAIANDTWTNKTAVSQTVTYAVIPRIAAGCIGDEENIVVTIDPEPDLANLDKTVCSDEAIAVTLADVHTLSDRYNVLSITPQGGLNAGGGNVAAANGVLADYISADTWNNKTANPLTVTYNVVPYINAGCVGDAEDIVVTINPEPDLANLDKTVCSDEAIAVTLADVHTLSNRYNVLSITPQGGLIAGGGNVAPANGVLEDYIIADTWNNKTANPLTVTYNVVPYINGGCVGDAEDVVVTINPEPDLDNLDATVCSDEVTGVTLADVHGLADRFEIVSITPTGGIIAGGGNSSPGAGQLSDAIVNDTWTNKTAIAQTVTYAIIPRLNGGCIGDQENIVVTIDPEPDLNTPAPTVCSDDIIGVTLSDVHGLADRFDIVSITPTGGIIAGGGNSSPGAGQLSDAIVNDTWTNKTAIAQTVTYAIIPRLNGGCIGDQENIVVTIDPEPDLANLDKTVCSDEAIAVTLADVHTLSNRYNVLSITPQGGLIAGGGNVAPANGVLEDYIIADTWNNKTANPLTVTYNVVPYINGGCVGDAEDVVVTINPEPDLDNLDATVCSDEVTGVTLADVHGLADRFEIVSITPTGGIIAGGGNSSPGAGQLSDAIVNDTWTNKTAIAQTVTYAIIPRLNGGCIGDQENIVVTIDPEPDLNTPAPTVCSDDIIGVTLSDVHGLADRFEIVSITPTGGIIAGGGNSSPGAGQLSDAIVNDTWTNKTAIAQTVTYAIIPRLNGGCIGDQENIVVTIDPEPDLDNLDATVCSDEVTGVTLADVHGLADRFEIVSITPTGGIIAGGGNSSPGAGQLSDAIVNDTWTNKTAIAQTVTYAIIPRLNGGCIGDQENIVVTIDPEPVITNGQATAVCSDNALDYQILLDNFTNPADNVTFTWPAPSLIPVDPAFTGGTARAVPSAANITDTFTNTLGAIGTATYTITPYKNGCAGDPETVVFSVGSEPVLDPNLDKFVCSNIAIALTLKEDVGSVVPTHYNIISVTIDPELTPAGGNAVVPFATAAANYLEADEYANVSGVDKDVVYNVQPVLAPDCFGDPVDVTVTIRSEPVITFPLTETICSHVAANRSLTLSNGVPGTTFEWGVPANTGGMTGGTAGAPGSSGPITDVFSNLTGAPQFATYIVTPTSGAGCAGSASNVVITVNPYPLTTEISGESNLCVGSINNIYEVTNTPGSTYSWTIPAHLTEVFNTNLYFIIVDAASTGTADVEVIETNSFGCVGPTKLYPVTVSPYSIAATVTGTADTCNGATGVKYSVPFNAGSSYSWTTPPGASITSDPTLHEIDVDFSLVVTGDFSVVETNASGCVTIHNPLTVTIHPVPNIYNLTAPSYYCFGDPGVTLTLSTSQAGVDYQLYKDGNPEGGIVAGTGAPLTWNNMTAGTYTVLAEYSGTGCPEWMNGNPTVVENPEITGTTTITSDYNGEHISCNGAGDGKITVAANGGFPPYEYSIDGGSVYQGSNVFTGLSSGPVTVTIRDFRSCTKDLAPVTLIDPPLLTASAVVSSDYNGADISCAGAFDGSIDLTPGGGTGAYTYAWTGPNGYTNNVDQDPGGLEAGIYDVTVSDANGCFENTGVTLTEPTILTVTSAVSSDYNGEDISCNGAGDGVATATPAGGTVAGVYGYAWYSDAALTIPIGQTTQTATNLSATTYWVEVTDDNGCTASTSVTLTEPTIVTVTAAVSSDYNGEDISCNGAGDGAATATPGGGTVAGVYGYAWYSDAALTIPIGQTTQTATNLSATTYWVEVTDDNGCTASTSVTLTEPTIVTVTAAVSSDYNGEDISCNGAGDGAATATPGGGTVAGVYGYAWYSDAALTIPIGQTTQTATNLSAITYWVEVTDDNGCTASTSVTLTEPTIVTVTAAVSSDYNGEDISCNGASDGAATATPGGGTVAGAYNYAWYSDAALTIPIGQTTQTATNLSAITYWVEVTDDNGCTASTSVTLTEPTTVTVTAAVSSDYNGEDISCNGAGDGAATATPGGGTVAGAYNYAWYSDAALTIPIGQTTQTATNLSAITYWVEVTDDNGCTASTSVTLTEPTVVTVTAAVSSDYNGEDISCNGAGDGAATATPGGGTVAGAYNYAWYSDAALTIPIGQTTQTATNLSANTYWVEVTDDNGCTASTSVTLTEPTIVTVTAAVSSDYNGEDISCNGAGDGAATATPGGGTVAGAYNYAWYSDAALTISIGQTTQTATNLSAGTYWVEVTDDNGCTASTSVTLTEPTIVTVTAAVSSDYNGEDISCNGAGDGAATATPGGGTVAGAYNYAWYSDAALTIPIGQTTQTATNLSATTYWVEVTDDNGCTASTSVTLTEPTIVTVTAAVSSDYNGEDVSCNGAGDGAATATPGGGTVAGAYNYAWYSDAALTIPIGQTTQTATNLSATTYWVEVTDDNGCTASTSVTLTEPTIVTVTAVVSSDYNGEDVSCNGAGDGAATATPGGGTVAGVYNYVWYSDAALTIPIGQTTQTATNLSANTYWVEVTDDNGCTASTSVTLTEPTIVTVTAAVSSDYNGEDISCNGAGDGAATATPAGGTVAGVYGYVWYSDAALTIPIGQTTQTATNLSANTYWVEVIDDNGCTASTSVTLTEPTIVTITAAVSSDYNGEDISCNGAGDGAATATPGGGTVAGVYGYAWYSDAALTIPIGQTTQTATNLSANTYWVEVTDDNGCTASTSVTLTEPTIVTVTAAVSSDYNGEDISCNGAGDGAAIATPGGGTVAGAYNYAWYSDAALTIPIGQTTQTATNLSAITYWVEVTDDNGCTASTSVTLTEPTVVTVTAAVSSDYNGEDISCNGAGDGAATATPGGGTVAGAYNYAWYSDAALTIPIGQTTQTATNLSAITYWVEVTDDNGCTASTSVTLTEPTTVTVTAAVSSDYNGEDISCNGAGDGAATATPAGGTVAGVYGYVWYSDAALTIPIGQTTQTATNLSANTYWVEVIDDNGCTASTSVTLTEPTIVTVTAAVSSDYNGEDISCNGAGDGAATATPGGGTVAGVYGYAWYSDAALTIPIGQTTQTATNLSANTYWVEVTDDNGCTASTSVTLTEPTIVTVTAAVSSDYNGEDISCNGAGDGAATATPGGGTVAGAYNYAWYSDAALTIPIGQTTQTATNLSAITYWVEVTDDNGCTASTSVTLTEPTVVTVTAAVSSDYNGEDISCNGAGDGAATATPGGGTVAGAYNYVWYSDAALTIPIGQTTQTTTNLSAITYWVEVTDDNGCTASTSVTLTEPTAVTVTAAVSSDYNGEDISCNGANDGAATATPAGGTVAGVYGYAWYSDAALTIPIGQTTQTATNLSAITYWVEVTDDNGCTASTSVTLTEPTLLAIDNITSPTYNGGYNISCNGYNDGSINITISGGTTPYTYLWSGPAGYNSTNEDPISLKAGDYSVTVTDANGCNIAGNITLTEPDPLTISSITSLAYAGGFNISCNGLSDGSIDLTVADGTPAYTYAWTGPDSYTSTDEDPSGLKAGTYLVTVTDNNNCVKNGNIALTQPQALTGGFVNGDQSICSGGDPTAFTIAVPVTGASGNYLYQWTEATAFAGPFSDITGATNATYDPPAGLTQTTYYQRSVTSATCGPELSNIVTVTVNPMPTASVSGDAVICSGFTSDITVTLTGLAPWSFTYTNGSDNTTVFTSVNPYIFAAGIDGIYEVIAVSDANGCAGTDFGTTATLTVNPGPVLATDLNDVACSDVASGIILDVAPSSVAAANYNITNINVGGGLTPDGGNAIVANGLSANAIAGDIFTNTTIGALNVVYDIVPVSGDGCEGNIVQVTLTVNPEPILNPGLDASNCSGETTGITLSSAGGSVPAATYNINNINVAAGLVADAGNTTTGNGQFSDAIADDKFVNPTSGALTVVYDIVPVTSSGCEGDMVQVTLTVDLAPALDPNLDATVCSGDVSGIVFDVDAGSVPASHYNITNIIVASGLVPDAGNAMPGNGKPADAIALDKFTNTTSVSLNVVYDVIPVPVPGCLGETVQVTLTVNPEPVLDPALSTTVCSDEISGITLAVGLGSVAAADYNITNINVAGGLVAGGGNAIAANGVASDAIVNDVFTNTTTAPLLVVYDVVPVSADNCEGETVQFTLTVYPEPVLASGLDNTVCSDESSGITFTVAGGSVGANSYDITNITVPAALTPDAMNATTGTNLPASKIIGDKFTNTTGGALTVVYSVVPVSSAGCAGDTVQISLTVNPEPVLDPALDVTVCSDAAGGIVFSVNAGSVSASNYNINSINIAAGLVPDGSNSSVGNAKPANAVVNDIFTNQTSGPLTVTYNVAPVSANGCVGESVQIILTVDPEPELSYALNKNVCSDVETGIVLSVASSSVAAASYNIELITMDASLTANAANATVGTGLSSDAIQHDIFTNTSSLAATVVYDIVPVSAAGCVGDMKQITHTVYPEPVMTSGLTETVCSGAYTSLPLSITNAVAGTNFNWVVPVNTGGMTGGTAGPSTYISDIFDNTTGSTQTATYKVVPVSGFGCIGDTTDVVITVNSNPVADINSGPDTILVCGGQDLQLDGNPTGGSGTYSSHLWSGMVGPLDNSSIQTPIFNYSLNGEFNLTYTVIDDNGCQGSDVVVIVNDNPNALFSVDQSSSCSPHTVNFTNNSMNAVSYEWTFGDGSPSETTTDPSHEFVNQTISIQYYSVQLVTQSANGCRDSTTQVITVYPGVDSEFSITPDTVCHGATTTMAAQPGGSIYFWDYGDGDSEYTGNVANHVFTNTTNGPVTYTVVLTAESFYSCSSQSQKEVVVYPSPVAAFIATPANQVFPNATVTITDLTNTGNWDYLYDFGDSTTSVEANPEHTYNYPGTYTISMTVSNDKCSDDATGYITITPTPPIAGFDEVESGCMPWEISFNNTSEYGDTYYWDFGDGSVSTSENPTYTYYEAGAFVVKLTVRGAGGIDEFTRVVESYQTPNAYLDVIPSLVYVNDESIRCLNLSENADSWVWEFGDGDTSHVYEPFHTYMEEGVFDVTLHAYTDEGCSDTYILSPAVTVEPAGELQFATAFRPNPDGPTGGDIPTGEDINTVFFPPIKEMVDEYQLQIFNRWGERIFVSNDINTGWDGYYKGKLAKQDVYIWKVTGQSRRHNTMPMVRPAPARPVRRATEHRSGGLQFGLRVFISRPPGSHISASDPPD